MRIELTKEQFKEMLLAAMLYSWVRGGLVDSRGEDFKKYEELEKYLLKIAKDNELQDLVEEFHDHLVPTDELAELEEEIMEEYDDDIFWHELVTRLGGRDFWRTVTPEERKTVEEKGWLPERVSGIYEKYEKEFEERGLDRVRIDEEKL